MSDSRPPLTQRARELLEEYQERTRNRIHNIAEEMALKDGRKEINETDILQARKKYSSYKPSTLRKWCIRILILLTFGTLGTQIDARAVLVLIFMVAFTLVFREDWL